MLEITMEQLREQLSQMVGDAVRASVPAAPAAAPELHPRVRQELEAVLAQDEGAKLIQDLIDQGKVKFIPAASGAGEGQTAEQEMRGNPVAGAVKSLDGALGYGIPWGSALVGGTLALVVSEVVDGVVNGLNQSDNIKLSARIGAKGAGAWAALQYGEQFLGKQGAMFTAGFLVFSAARDVPVINEAITNLINWITGAFSGGNRFRRYAPAGGFEMLPAAPQGQWAMNEQILPGFGGVGHDALASVFH